MQERVMEKCRNSVITQQELEEVHRIAVTLTTRKLPERDKSPVEKWFERAAELLFSHSIAILVALTLLMSFSAILDHESLRAAALVCGVLFGLIVIAAWFVGIGGAVPFFNRIRRKPYSPMLWSIKAATQADCVELSKLMACRREVVALYLLQYKHERESFERRCHGSA
ncbi:hypothetical protein [Paraburkholderia sp. CNPSo 3281]|uniref:hypothetical protein n=1 Tax=Paraburkholderia sp. CNPSo 3281 TaxID=2940933 RepID=UPI0020B670DB|nr:hypothetical protein [Paraburkholderia sp. CNPSo 3281]MCP3721458.1 hypothetical protein [Paraburkholderia sp. CNPSo 3281]